MYETHFGFHRQPFQSADASRAFFVSESIRTILPQLLHALRSDLGIAVLTGVPGSGKTSLLRHLQQVLSGEGRAIVCSGASLGTSLDLFGVLLQASRMKAGSESTTKSNAADPVSQPTRSSAMEHMKRTAELWGPILLLIDDAQLVPLAVLNELRACTEEEWNGRDLVRCLVSAPISFEEQLARPEYAEFGRRIRCHAFLQPLKAVESIRFLQEQIELAGGRFSQVFTTPALELIATAADGIPRCLSLLADESLVVAAECGEKTTTELSVRTALSRLQHLQYNWNASPHADIAEVPLSDEEHTADEPTRQVVSPPVMASVSRQTPARATLSPGVIEFGGPSMAAAIVRPAARSLVPSVLETRSSTVVPTIEISTREEESVASQLGQASPAAVIEFGAPQAFADVVKSEPVTIRSETTARFQVGHRFSGESLQDSISVENVDDSDILDLLDAVGKFDAELWDDLSYPETVSPLDSISSATAPARSAELEDIGITGNAGDSVVDQAAVAVATDKTTANDTPLISEQTILTDEPLSLEPALLDRSPEERIVAATIRPSNSGFIDLGDSRLSNRTPVFDRYTWLALGREVPLGTGSIVSPTKTKQLILADYGMLASNQLATLCSQMASGSQTASVDQIPITLTTDSDLIDEISNDSQSREKGSFVLFRNVLRSVQEVPDQVEVLVADEASPTVPGLKIWHDGQLIFAQSGDSVSPDAAEASVQQSAAIVNSVDETAGTRPAPQPDTAPLLSAGGFFTLPVPIEKADWNLQSPGIAEDQDVFPIVETITSLQSDVRHFQQTGRTPGNDSSGPDRQVSPGGQQVPEPDNLISRAKRRLDDRTTVADSTVVALQMAPDIRTQRTAAAAAVTDAEPASAETGNPGSVPQFSRLFTRLWENRRRAAGHAETDR